MIVSARGTPQTALELHQAWSRARTKVGRTDLHFHDLRHSGLTWAAATGATMAELMDSWNEVRVACAP